MLAPLETLLIIEDVIVDESLNEQRQCLFELAASVRHHNHYILLLTQSYLPMLENLRRQVEAIFVWHLKERAVLKTIHDENNCQQIMNQSLLETF